MRTYLLVFIISAASFAHANSMYPMPFEKVTLEGESKNMYDSMSYTVIAIVSRQGEKMFLQSLEVHVDDDMFRVPGDMLRKFDDPRLTQAQLINDCCIIGESYYLSIPYGPVLECEIFDDDIEPINTFTVSMSRASGNVRVSHIDRCEFFGSNERLNGTQESIGPAKSAEFGDDAVQPNVKP